MALTLSSKRTKPAVESAITVETLTEQLQQIDQRLQDLQDDYQRAIEDIAEGLGDDLTPARITAQMAAMKAKRRTIEDQITPARRAAMLQAYAALCARTALALQARTAAKVKADKLSAELATAMQEYHEADYNARVLQGQVVMDWHSGLTPADRRALAVDALTIRFEAGLIGEDDYQSNRLQFEAAERRAQADERGDVVRFGG